MRLFLLLAVSCFLHGFACAATISGKVVTGAGAAVAAASVVLEREGDKILAGTDITADDGSFSISSVPGGTYLLHIVAAGYAQHSERVVVAGSDLSLPAITLAPAAKQLKEVTITSQKPLIEIHADKLVVNVENSIVNTGSSVYEVLGRSPGVMIDQSDNINLKGRPGVTVMMNGKIMPVSGADLANLLKGMPSSSIEKIEIISNPGARYDAAGSGGIINILTKRDRRKGLNGNVNATYGQGIYNKANGGGNINDRTGALNLSAGYNYADREGFSHLGIVRKFSANDVLRTQYTQQNHTYFPVKNHAANLGADYTVSSRTTVGVSATGNSSRFRPQGDNVSRVDSGRTTYFHTHNDSRDAWDNYSLNGYLRHRIDTGGRELSADLDYARYWNQTYQLYTTTYRDADGALLRPDYLLYGDLSGLTQIRSAKVDYVHPLAGGMRLDAGAKSSYVTADNRPLFYDRSSGADVPDSSKSNHFVYSEHINAAYLNGAIDKPKWSAQLGLRGEHTYATGDQKITGQRFTRSYFQLFPSLAVQRHLDEANDVGVTLSRRIDRPGYRQLNPFKYFLDPTNYRMGNPYLNPTLTYAVELSHTYKQRFITSATISRATNVITETLEADEVFPNISKQTDKNLAEMYYYGLSCAYPFQLAKWWQHTVNANFYYSIYRGNLSNTPLNRGRGAFDVNMTSSITLPKGFSAEAGFYYQSAMNYGYYELVPVWSVNAGIQKKVMKDKATVKLSATDITWANRPGATIVFSNFTEIWSSYRDSRVVNLTFVYRFGHATGNRRHSSGAEEEKRRAGGG